MKSKPVKLHKQARRTQNLTLDSIKRIKYIVEIYETKDSSVDVIAGDCGGKVNCYILNADNDLLVAKEYEIKAVPVILLFKNGEKRESIMGTMPKEFYISAIESVLNT